MRTSMHLAAAATFAALAALGCERNTESLQPMPLSTEALVFADDFAPGIEYQAFLNTNLDAASIDEDIRYEGSASLKIAIPPPGHPIEWFAGGAMVAGAARDLSGYDALTFWARATTAVTLDVAGLGDDNTGTSKYWAILGNINLTPTWTKHVVPVPLPEKLSVERGLFFFAEGHENVVDYDIWFDDVRFENLGTITHPRPFMESTPQPVGTFVGETLEVQGTGVTFNVDGTDLTIAAAPGYFTFVSSDESVAKVVDGEIRIIADGSATITAELGSVPATGALRLNATIPPSTAAPIPDTPAGDVISLFSNVYDNHPVENWLAFGTANVTDLQIAADDVKAYTNLRFAGISFANPTVDATAMTHLHMHVWAPNAAIFKVKLVDFGADGAFGGAFENRDSEHELSFTAATDPPFASGTWVELDIPLADFTSLLSTAHLAQIIISITGIEQTVFLDNIFFHR